MEGGAQGPASLRTKRKLGDLVGLRDPVHCLVGNGGRLVLEVGKVANYKFLGFFCGDSKATAEL